MRNLRTNINFESQIEIRGTYNVAPIASLHDCNTRKVMKPESYGGPFDSPYSLYPKASINLCANCKDDQSTFITAEGGVVTSANWGGAKPFFFGAGVKPNPGRLGATTWNAGASDSLLVGEVSRGRILRTSPKCPGPNRRLSRYTTETSTETYTHAQTRAVSRSPSRSSCARSAP